MAVSEIQQAIQYMEDHLLEDITYVDAARSVRMSGYSFHRMFSFLVGMTANEYIRSRRLSLAGQALQEGGLSVIEAAYQYGYESPESFSKAFSRFHGSTPRQAKIKGTPLRAFGPLAVKITIGGGSMIDYRMERREAQKFLAVKRAFSNETMLDENGRSIPDFWGECGANGLIDGLKALRPQGKRDLFGLCGPVLSSESHFWYGIGVRLDEETGPAEAEALLDTGCAPWQTGPAEYAVFPCVGPDGECVGQVWERFFQEFLPQTGLLQTDGTDYELYYEQGGKGLFCELWVPVARG